MPLRRNSKLKYVIDFLLSFFTALTLFVSVASAILFFTVCNDNYMLFSIERSGYQQLNLEEFIQDLHYISEPIGIDASLLSETVDSDQIKKNIIESVNKSYNDETYTPDSTAFTGKIYNTIQNYAAENDLEVDEENFDHVTEVCADIYTKHSAVSYVSSIGHYAAKFRIPLLVISIVMLLIGLVLIRQLWHMHYRKFVSIRFMIYGISATALALIAFPLWILASGKIQKASISVASLYNLFVTYSNFLLELFIFTGLFIIVIALILVVFYNKFRKLFYGK